MNASTRRNARARLFTVLFLVAVTASMSARAAEPGTPLEVFGRLASLEDVVLSPDGNRIAFIRTFGDDRALVVVPLGDIKAVSGLRIGKTKLRSVRWIDDDNVLITVSSTSPPPIGFWGPTREWYQGVIYNVSKRATHPLTFDVSHEETFNVIDGESALRQVGGKSVLYTPGYYVTDRTLPGLFAYSVEDRRVKLIDKGTQPLTDWLVDETGRIAVKFAYDDEKKLWQIKALKDGRMTVVASGTAAIDIPSLIGFSADGGAIIVRFVENGDPIWKPLMLKDDTWGAALGEGKAFASEIKDRKTGRIIGGVPNIDDAKYVFFDNEMQAHWNAVLREFPDERVILESHSDDYSKIVVKVLGLKKGFRYELYEWYGHRSTGVGPVYEGLTNPSEIRPISYPAADGFRIPGFLTLPHGVPEKNLPLIVLPHGGPETQDTQDFAWWPQALAAQGYAVLQPNFRGSTINQSFVEAGFGEWGRKMQTDLSDGVRFFAKQGTIDPKRVCIVGASYGGYAALAGVTLDPGVYRCAVAVAGISDMRRFRKWITENDSRMTGRYWDRFIGSSDPNSPELRAISPIEHIGAVNVPVLLIHGKDDTVVPYEQSDTMLSALKRAGKSVQFVTLKHEDHWLSSGATRLQMLQESVAFLKANNPPD